MSTTKSRRQHWATGRPADITHNGRSIWRAPHDSQPRVFLDYWYCEDSPVGGDNEFDVRCLPGYTEFPGLPMGSVTTDDVIVHLWKQRTHHAAIIMRCIDDGVDLLTGK